MPEALKITLIVIGSIFALWLLLLIIDLIFVGSFSMIFNKHKKAITVILYTKLENIRKMCEIINQSGIKVDDKITKTLSSINDEDFNEPGTEAYENSKNGLSYLKDELFFMASDNSDLSSNNEFVQAKKNVNDSDVMYRNNVVMYNADVLGYNYWIRFLPVRFIYKMFRIKEKQIIS